MLNKEIYIIFHGPFPKGNVSTLRVLSYAKALVNKGYQVTVFIPSPTKDASVNDSAIGYFEGVKYNYVIGITWKNKVNLLIKLIYYIIGLIKISYKIIKNRPQFVLLYDSEIIRNFIFSILSKIMSIKLVMDITEYPKGFKNHGKFRKKLEKFSLFGFNKLITITNELCLFYNSWLNVQSFLLPVTIDPKRFDFSNELEVEPYILCLFGTHNRDSIIDTILGYVKYNELTSSPLKLYMVGDIEKLCELYQENKKIFEILEKEKIEENVKFLGVIKSDNIPKLLKKSMCLITTPREFVSGGFPTKLGEYLLSGRPVIATKVGELSSYLTDNKNVFFVSPNDSTGLGKKIHYVENNPFKSNLIANNGKELALKVFNANYYINDLIKYVEN